MANNKQLHNEMHGLVEMMISKMEEGTGSWIKSWSTPYGAPMNFKTKANYRGFNAQHPEYLQAWVKALKADPQILWRAASEAQKAFDYLQALENKKEKAA